MNSTPPTTILKDIIISFSRNIYYTRNAKQERVTFPTLQARAFCTDFEELLSKTFGDNLRGDWFDLYSFVHSMKVASSSLKGKEGIRAMCTFLNVAINMLTSLSQEKEFMDTLVRNNEGISCMLNSLRRKVEEMERKESDYVESIDGVSSLTLRLPESTDLEWLCGAIPMIGSGHIVVLTSYKAVPRSESNVANTPVLVVVYEDMDLDGSSWIPPYHQSIYWRCINKLNRSAREESSLFSNFCGCDRLASLNLLLDFFDPSVKKILQIPDTTCIYPSVRLSLDNTYEPFLTIGVFSTQYRGVDCDHIPTKIVTSSGRTLPIHLCEGLLLKHYTSTSITPGTGVSAASQYNNGGSIAGIVKDETNTEYFLTCEHVLASLKRSCLAGETTIQLRIPSLQSVFNPLASLFNCPNDRVDDSILKSMVNSISSTSSLMDPPESVSEDQLIFTCEMDTLNDFSKVQADCSIHSSIPAVKITGDIGLLPIPTGITGMNLDFTFEKVTRWSEIVQYMMKRQHIKVRLSGAASGIASGTIVNFIHVKSVDTTSLQFDSTTLFQRTLYGQYLLEGNYHDNNNPFGKPGDSGGLVSICPTSQKQHIVGVFVGKCSNDQLVVTPAEILLTQKYDFLPKN